MAARLMKLRTRERTVGAALRGRPAWNSVSSLMPRASSAPGGHGGPPLQYVLVLLLFLSACGGKVITRTEAKPQPPAPPKPPTSVPFWLGNASRNFYGTGPSSHKPLEVVWSFETKGISGRLHKDPWGGSSWPGQPSVDEQHVYFGSADGRLYCLDAKDGSLIWSYKTEDSLKATPTIIGDRLIASGLDHYIYCIDKNT